jgi:hypothetical protein
MTFRKQLIARKHRKMAQKIEEKMKLKKATASHGGHPAVKAHIVAR